MAQASALLCVQLLLLTLLPMIILVVVVVAVAAVGEEVIEQQQQQRLSEPERVQQWLQRNSWPPRWQKEHPSYTALMEQREAELMQLTGADERWENWMQFTQARMLPTFTELGFEVIQTPAHVQAKLKAAVDAAVRDWDNLPEEDGVRDSIYGPHIPKWVHLNGLEWEVASDLQQLHEEWAGGVQLRPTSAYGVRLYRNGSSMVMHNDKPHSHVISAIVHIAHEYDDSNTAWPIYIEDHFGRLHSVALEEGQMLFYESAKCLHGRMSQLQGRYYGSLFVHYQPVDRSVWDHSVEEVINNVPPHWSEGVQEQHGSRWCGQGITVDSRVVAGAPERVVGNGLPARNQPQQQQELEHQEQQEEQQQVHQEEEEQEL